MRLVVEKWVLTRTLNQQTNVVMENDEQQLDTNNVDNLITSNNIRNDIVIEQTLHQEQLLYQNLNDSLSDQSDHSISMTNLDEIDNNNNNSDKPLPQVSTLFMNINNDTQNTNITNQHDFNNNNNNKPINLLFTNINSPYKRNEVIVYLDAYTPTSSSLSKTESNNDIKSNSNNILVNTQSLMKSNNKYQLEKGSVNNNTNNNNNKTNLQDSMSTTLLLNVSITFFYYFLYLLYKSIYAYF